MSKTVQFWSLKEGKHIEVPAKDCTLKEITTSRGVRKQVTANVGGAKLSKFVAKDFEL